jgi:hypothetical protein
MAVVAVTVVAEFTAYIQQKTAVQGWDDEDEE